MRCPAPTHARWTNGRCALGPRSVRRRAEPRRALRRVLSLCCLQKSTGVSPAPSPGHATTLLEWRALGAALARAGRWDTAGRRTSFHEATAVEPGLSPAKV